MAKGNETQTIERKTTNASGFTRKKAVTLPSFVIKKEGDVRNFLFTSAMRKSDVVTKDKDGKAQEPATVANVTDLNSGEEGIYLVNTVVAENLRKMYPDDGYVQKKFEIEHKGKKDGKRYGSFSVYELE